MKLGKLIAVFSLCVGVCAPVQAQEREGVWVTYYLKSDTEVVSGLMQIAVKTEEGNVPASYTLKRISKFIAQDCASGKVGKITQGEKKTKRKWNFVRQRFQTTCKGGPNPRIGSTTGNVQVQIKRQPDGRDLAEYFFGKNGNMVTEHRYR